MTPGACRQRSDQEVQLQEKLKERRLAKSRRRQGNMMMIDGEGDLLPVVARDHLFPHPEGECSAAGGSR